MACGTYGGYQAHRNAGEEACEPCRQALRTYQADYRRRNPHKVVADQVLAAARDRALRRLARKYPTEFCALYKEEKERS